MTSNFKKAAIAQQTAPIFVDIELVELKMLFNMSFPADMAWLARWFVDAYNREQPKPKDWGHQ